MKRRSFFKTTGALALATGLSFGKSPLTWQWNLKKELGFESNWPVRLLNRPPFRTFCLIKFPL